jgi:hypothetical protein
MPNKTYETTALVVLTALATHPDGLTLVELSAMHPDRIAETIRSAACRLTTKGYTQRIAKQTWQITEKGHRLLAGEGHLNNFRAPSKEEIEENKQRNVPWINPIRARALGLTNPRTIASRSGSETASRSVASRSGLAGRRA